MNEIIKSVDINYLIKLGLMLFIIGMLSLSNILGSIYYSVGKRKQSFSKKKLLNGIIKVCIVVVMVVCITISFLIFNYLNLINSEIVDPFIILYAVAIYYFVKIVNILAKIFNFDLNKYKVEEEII